MSSVQNVGQAVDAHVYGCYSARIGASFNHTLEKPLTLPSGRFLRKGMQVFLALQDTTRNPKIAATAKWVCRHPDCRGKEFGSKAELVESHDANKILASRLEKHCYYAVAWIPGVDERAQKVGKNGEVLEEYIAPALPTLMLLSDEE